MDAEPLGCGVLFAFWGQTVPDSSDRQRSPSKPGVHVRCKGPRCPARGGAWLFRVNAGMVHIEYRLRSGERIEGIIVGVPYVWRCHACGYPWINPDAVATDGLAAHVQRALSDIAARVEQEQPNDQPARRGLRRPAA